MVDEKILMTKINEFYYDKVFDGKYSVAQVFAEVMTIISSQPKVGEWIPCSERLPKSKREEVVRSWYITTLATGAVVEKCFDFIKKEWVTDIEVIAWMPLPKPFKKGGAV